MNSIKTIQPQFVATYFTSNIDLLSAYTSFVSLNKQYINEIQTFIDYDIASSHSNFVESTSSFFVTTHNKLSSFNLEFIDYWISEYNYCINQIKDCTKTLPFFQPFSDSIGLLTNTISFNINDNPPFSISLYNKLSPSTKSLYQEMYKKTNTLYQRNSTNLQVKSPINDFNRLKKEINNITKTLNKNFNITFNMFQFYSTLNDKEGYNPVDLSTNLQKIPSIIIEEDVESCITNVDLLRKKVINTQQNTIFKSLSAI